MKKINFFVILTVIICFTMGLTSYASDFEEYKEKIPRLIIEEDEEIPQVAAGNYLDVVLKYVNDSQHNAYDLRITPIYDDMPIVYEKPQIYERKSSLRARGSDTASFSFKISDDAKVGVYEMKFKFEYANSRDENYSSELAYHFRVYKEKVKPIIKISNISTGEVSANSAFTLNFNIDNNGEVDASNVEVTLTGLSRDGFMAVDSNDYKYIGDILAGKYANVSFNMFASENIPKGTNSLNVEIKYKDTTGNELTTEKTIYVNDVKSEKEASDDDDGTSATPKIIISSYKTNPTSIDAGDVFNFTFNFKNTSKEKRLRNMKITIDSKDGAFIITKGSNTFYVEEIGVNEEKTLSIELKARQDLITNSYPIYINFDYEDFSGNDYTAQETINTPVTEYSNLVINSVYIDGAYVNQSTSLSFDYINMGKTTVSNLTASVEGDFTSVQPINYIGNLSAGSSDYYDIEVTPTKAGTIYGVLVLSFEDSSGQIIEVRKDFEGFAMEEQSFDDPGIIEPGDDTFIPSEPVETVEPIAVWVIVASGIGSFLVTFLVVKAITTKIVRRKLEKEL